MATQIKRAPLYILALIVVVFTFLSLEKSIVQHFSGPSSINPDQLTGEYDSTDTLGQYLGQEVVSPILPTAPALAVLGSSDEPKRIEVDLSTQRLYAYQGDTRVYSFPISSGKWYPTPTGTFHIWSKFRATKMSGGNPLLHTYYYLPNVPYVMFFANDEVAMARGFALHGTYWHNNFGHPMSHGCVNLRTQDAATLFYWTTPDTTDKNAVRATRDDPGTEIVITGETPID